MAATATTTATATAKIARVRCRRGRDLAMRCDVPVRAAITALSAWAVGAVEFTGDGLRARAVLWRAGASVGKRSASVRVNISRPALGASRHAKRSLIAASAVA